MEYDQRVIIRFLWNEGIDVDKITHRIHAQFGEYVHKLQTVRFWIAEVRLVHQDLHNESCAGILPLDDLDAKILVILNKSFFEPTSSIVEIRHVAHSIVFLQLYDSIGFRSFHLHWVPHLLKHYLLEKRKEHEKAMLPFLHAAERDGWHHLVIGEESWFFMNTSSGCVWTLSRDDVVTKPGLDIQSKNSYLRSCGTRAASMLSTDSQMI
jgi:hypothetical protein